MKSGGTKILGNDYKVFQSLRGVPFVLLQRHI